MFGLKNKKRLNAATTGFSSEPKPSASTRTIQRNSFEKVVTAGKNLCYNLSVTLTRKPCRQTSPINRSTSANRPSSNASTATTSNQNLDNCDAGSLCQKSSSSTLLTESSLLVLDCGETFYVPGISPSRSHLDTGRAPIQEPNGLSVSSMESATSWNNTKSLDQPEEETPAVPEQLYVKKGMKDRLCRHLKATYKNLILPRLLRFGRN